MTDPTHTTVQARDLQQFIDTVHQQRPNARVLRMDAENFEVPIRRAGINDDGYILVYWQPDIFPVTLHPDTEVTVRVVEPDTHVVESDIREPAPQNQPVRPTRSRSGPSLGTVLLTAALLALLGIGIYLTVMITGIRDDIANQEVPLETTTEGIATDEPTPVHLTVNDAGDRYYAWTTSDGQQRRADEADVTVETVPVAEQAVAERHSPAIDTGLPGPVAEPVEALAERILDIPQTWTLHLTDDMLAGP